MLKVLNVFWFIEVRKNNVDNIKDSNGSLTY